MYCIFNIRDKLMLGFSTKLKKKWSKLFFESFKLSFSHRDEFIYVIHGVFIAYQVTIVKPCDLCAITVLL